MVEGPISIVQPFTGYKMHDIKLHTRTKSMNNKTYSCDVVVKGTSKGDGNGVDYYGVLEEILLEYFCRNNTIQPEVGYEPS